MKLNRLNKFVLSLTILATLVLFLANVGSRKLLENEPAEAPLMFISLLLLISPYLYLLRCKLWDSDIKSIHIVMFAASFIIAIPALAINYYLIYINSDPQNAMVTMGILIFQWLLILVLISVVNFIKHKIR